MLQKLPPGQGLHFHQPVAHALPTGGFLLPSALSLPTSWLTRGATRPWLVGQEFSLNKSLGIQIIFGDQSAHAPDQSFDIIQYLTKFFIPIRTTRPRISLKAQLPLLSPGAVGSYTMTPPGDGSGGLLPNATRVAATQSSTLPSRTTLNQSLIARSQQS